MNNPRVCVCVCYLNPKNLSKKYKNLSHHTHLTHDGGPPERTEMAIPRGAGDGDPPWTPKFGSLGNCIIIGPGIYFLDRIVQNFGANNFGFHPTN